MDKCFVIQPFDNNKFDKRYTDIFHPSITNAGLEPYRIDKDLSVKIPIDEIEKGILESSICFAEISTNNPNVWYELGFAFACNKDVIMVCSDEREGNFPFDIQHRQIITYKTGSTSDFTLLGDQITRKIKAFQQKSKTVQTLHSTPVVEMEGLKSHEIALLIIIMENQFSSDEGISIYNLKEQMNKAGYTDIAASVGVKTLSKVHFVELSKAFDNWNNGQEYYLARLTEAGENWILNNQDQLIFRMDKPKAASADDLPF